MVFVFKIGNLITIAAALFAIIQRDTLSAGLAGLSISISLSVKNIIKKFEFYTKMKFKFLFRFQAI